MSPWWQHICGVCMCKQNSQTKQHWKAHVPSNTGLTADTWHVPNFMHVESNNMCFSYLKFKLQLKTNFFHQKYSREGKRGQKEKVLRRGQKEKVPRIDFTASRKKKIVKGNTSTNKNKIFYGF